MKKILLILLPVILITACRKENFSFVDICHYDEQTGAWKLMKVPTPALPAHETHGDVILADLDGDGYLPNNHCGYGQMGDCNDTSAAINPAAVEICGNGIDENCNGQVDENCIPSVTLCDQVWMLRNLDVTTYRNGDPIPQVTDPSAWANLTTGAWCYNQNNSAYGLVYGKLYNWYAVNDPRGLAPEGWHIPNHAEWNTFVACLGGLGPAGTNIVDMGFQPLLGGGRISNTEIDFYNPGDLTWWWSVTLDDNRTSALYLGWTPLLSGTMFLNYRPIHNGSSVRCLKD